MTLRISFGLSGLKPNIDNTKAVWFGDLVDCNVNLCTDLVPQCQPLYRPGTAMGEVVEGIQTSWNRFF